MLEILQQTATLVAVNKPAGVLVIPGRDPSAGPSVREQLKAQLGQDVWVVHRLDRDTSGVVLFALDAATHRTVSMAFEAGQVKKRYAALVRGHLKHPLDLTFALVEARKRRMKVLQVGGDSSKAKEARTLVRPTAHFADVTLVECEPLTGRQHQIRVHLSAAGYPLLVDHQYGDGAPFLAGAVTLQRTPLHAESLEVPALGFSARAPMAADMQAVCDALNTSPNLLTAR